MSTYKNTKHFGKYDSASDINVESLERPYVAYVIDEKKCEYFEPIDYSKMYLTTVALGDGTISFGGSDTGNTISYSTDNGSTWSTPTKNVTVNVAQKDRVMWKGVCTPTNNGGIGTFSSTASYDLEGNIASLVGGDSFIGFTTIISNEFKSLFSGSSSLRSAENLYIGLNNVPDSSFQYMFSGCTSLTTAPQLPATTLGNWCYAYMFKGCRSLTAAPQLPATSLGGYCYFSMFDGCTSLTTVPEVLPAQTLANECYEGMFASCTSLTTAPQLPATTLTSWCYRLMFSGCISLSSVTCLATDISAYNSTSNWLNGVAANGTFTKAANMSSWTSGANGIPDGWKVVDAS